MAAYGVTGTGHVDVSAVAEGFGVTRRSVYRWMAGRDGRTTPHIPHSRLDQLRFPPADVQRREAQAASIAREVITGLELPRGRGLNPMWEQRRWTEPHLVAVLDLDGPGVGLRQAAVTRGTPRSLQELRRRGNVADFTMVPTKFHATVLVAELLALNEAWRLYPGANRVTLARTQVWSADAPEVDLATLARNTFELDT